MIGNCETCVFWRDLSKYTAIKFQEGAKECRRRAPVGAVNYGTIHDDVVRVNVVSAWAVTAADDGCGEYEERK
jgi:hypothetical protein